MVKDIEKRIERVKAALDAQEQRKRSSPTLVYADGSRRTMGVIEAFGEIGSREDIVDVLSGDETTSSLLRVILGPWYSGNRKESSFSAASNGGRLALSTGGTFLPPDLWKGGCPMVTYSELFAYSLVIIGICGLFIQAYKKK